MVNTIPYMPRIFLALHLVFISNALSEKNRNFNLHTGYGLVDNRYNYLEGELRFDGYGSTSENNISSFSIGLDYIPFEYKKGVLGFSVSNHLSFFDKKFQDNLLADIFLGYRFKKNSFLIEPLVGIQVLNSFLKREYENTSFPSRNEKHVSTGFKIGVGSAYKRLKIQLIKNHFQHFSILVGILI